ASSRHRHERPKAAMSRLYLTKVAKQDLQAILAYIAQQRPQVADEVVDRLLSKCELLASHPLLGQVRAEFSGDYRSFAVERWVVFYRVVQDGVEIHRVMDGARNIDDLLG